MNWRIKQLKVTESTNDDVRRAAELEEKEGLVVHANSQTKGRGRHGRTWSSPVGNLYCSVLLRPNFKGQLLGQFSILASLAIYDTVQTYLTSSIILLKWPNDVLVDGKKISGVLLEAGPDWLIVGVGINILHYPKDSYYPSTSLAENGASDLVATDVLACFLNKLNVWYARYRKDGFEPLRQTWLARALKGTMSVRLADHKIEGNFVDLGEDARLTLKLADGTEQSIATGDIFPIRGP